MNEGLESGFGTIIELCSLSGMTGTFTFNVSSVASLSDEAVKMREMLFPSVEALNAKFPAVSKTVTLGLLNKKVRKNVFVLSLECDGVEVFSLSLGNEKFVKNGLFVLLLKKS